MEVTSGPIIAATDYMKVLADQLAPWLAGRLVSLGTDGYGRSESRTHLRRFFEVDARIDCRRRAEPAGPLGPV